MEDICFQELPDLSPVRKNEVMDLLSQLGVKELQHLSFVKDVDLCSILTPIEARILVKSWSIYGSPCPSPNHKVTRSGNSSPSDVDSTSLSVSNSSENAGWTSRVLMPWHLCHPDLLEACENGKRPEQRHRLDMVCKFADEIMLKTKCPKLKDIEMIARDIVKKYPKSFEDSVEGKLMGTGYTTMTNWLFNRIVNIKRQSRKLSPSGESSASIKRRKSVEKYGHVKFANSETDAERTSMKADQDWLKIEHSKCNRNYDVVERKMKQSFALQRHFIDESPAIKTVESEWPFLLHPDYLFMHYGILVGKEGSKLSLLTSFVDGTKKVCGLVSLVNISTTSYFQPTNFRALKNSANLKIVRCVARIERDCYLFKNTAAEECGFIDLIATFMGEEISSIYVCTEVGYLAVLL